MAVPAMRVSETAPARSVRSRWELGLELKPRGPRDPLFTQIVRSIVTDIQRGRLSPGTVLPGTRALARALGVSRMTALVAYEELAAEGWIDIRQARRPVVATDIPLESMQPRLRPRRAEREAPVYRLSSAPRVEPAAEHMTGVLVMGGSAPDTRLIDVEPLARAYRRVLHDSRGSVLRYGDAAGHPRLRSALAAMLASTRGLTVGADQIFVTRGSQMALSLVARSILRRGDVVAVEALGYRHAWQAFRLAGARLLPVLVDAGGLDVAALARCAEQQRIAAVYVTPHHQFPTTVTLTQDRRQNLLELARRKGIAIIEDDYDHEFHYEGPSVMPLASLGGTATVIYVGTLSKILAPGLRIGYVAAAAELLERLAAYRAFADMQGDFVVEGAVAELMETGEVQRHVRRVRLEYRRRRDLLADRLRARLGQALSLERPSGGLAVWASSRPGTDIDRWAAAALDHGVAFQTAHTFTFSGERLPHARLGYGTLNEMEIVETVERLAAAHVAVTPG